MIFKLSYDFKTYQTQFDCHLSTEMKQSKKSDGGQWKKQWRVDWSKYLRPNQGSVEWALHNFWTV